MASMDSQPETVGLNELAKLKNILDAALAMVIEENQASSLLVRKGDTLIYTAKYEQ